MALKKLLPLIIYFALFGAGFYVRDLQQARQELKQAKADKIEIIRKIDISQKNGNELELELKKVQAHENNIISTAIKTKDRPFDGNGSFDDNFIELFNTQSHEYERILSSEHDADVP